MPARRAAICGAMIATLLAATMSAAAESYPTGPVRVLVPFGAGGATDVVARVFAERLQQRMGHSFTVENRGGAAGQIAAAAFARSPERRLHLDVHHRRADHGRAVDERQGAVRPAQGLHPGRVVAVQPVWVVVNAASPFKSLADIVTRAKANPGKLTYGTSGVGTELHLAAEAVARSAGIQMVHVPFRGGGEVITALLGSQIDFAALSTASIAGAVKQGTLRVLAVSSPKRMTDFPDVPTFAELGHGGATMVPWWGLMAPAGTPPPIVARLTQELEAATKDEAVRERLKATFVQIDFAGPLEFAAASRRRDQALRRDHPGGQDQDGAAEVKRSTDKIRTTHAGRLPNSPGCDDLPFRLFRGEAIDPAVIEAGLVHVVRRQLDIGVDIIGDGEFWKSRSFAYYSRHLTGVETRRAQARRAGLDARLHARARRVRRFLQRPRRDRHDLPRPRREADAARDGCGWSRPAR